jgi:hypothetical protein
MQPLSCLSRAPIEFSILDLLNRFPSKLLDVVHLHVFNLKQSHPGSVDRNEGWLQALLAADPIEIDIE